MREGNLLDQHAFDRVSRVTGLFQQPIEIDFEPARTDAVTNRDRTRHPGSENRMLDDVGLPLGVGLGNLLLSGQTPRAACRRRLLSLLRESCVHSHPSTVVRRCRNAKGNPFARDCTVQIAETALQRSGSRSAAKQATNTVDAGHLCTATDLPFSWHASERTVSGFHGIQYGFKFRNYFPNWKHIQETML